MADLDTQLGDFVDPGQHFVGLFASGIPFLVETVERNRCKILWDGVRSKPERFAYSNHVGVLVCDKITSLLTIILARSDELVGWAERETLRNLFPNEPNLDTLTIVEFLALYKVPIKQTYSG
ncbi:CUN083 hypothetical protein [Culex nigripalpus nucleopolyhedrovirus]|uniref:Uncharacterized protein n=1 Tax=Culex nigripalpus nucleopolyhedrovirus (isolate Florida/1997) TaxID=645993 RepID=Q919J2_NPVCO|nr:CUN083 hypothetical protein [Culex nigripalpus nucleopolyhedrovirus]AAK94161.1 CUN083 hypothetical protein [Culex nigripalpus nucleopolyhedrovirus]